jgi:hypothetical protein
MPPNLPITTNLNPASELEALQSSTGAAQSQAALTSAISNRMTQQYAASQQAPAAAPQAQGPLTPEQVAGQQQTGPQQPMGRSAPTPPRMTPVNSSTVKMVGYDQNAGEMHVQFKSGAYTYVHSGVDPQTFMSFLNSKSKGLFYANTFKGETKKYPFRKVKPTPPLL